MKSLKALFSLAALCAAATFGTAQAAAMSVSSSSFADGAMIPKAMAGTGPACGDGQAISPAVSWKDLPAGSQSVALVLFDPDGGKGQGVVHWIAYNIAADRGGLKQGEAQRSIEGVTVGVNSAGDQAYRGLCPPAGDNPHHYVLTVIATDQKPGSLPDKLDRAALLEALKGHFLAGQTLVGRYGH